MRAIAIQSQARGAGILVLCAVLSPCLLSAQSTGRITGIVVDASDALVSEANVECLNSATGLLLRTTTNTGGIFHFPDLPIGGYQITVAHTGFQKLVRGGIELLTGHTVDLRLRLQVGAVTQAIDVTTEIPLLQSASSEVQTTIDSRSMRELPLNGRNPLELVVLTPGADFTDVGTVANLQADGATEPQQDNTGLTVNGMRSTDNNFTLDGAGYNNPQFGSAPTLPNPDTLEEFTVKSSNFNALESKAGAVVQLATRSGSNRFHGSAFEFLRNEKLDARNFFGAQRMPFKRNQFGATLGGPVIKNKLLFFGSYQGTMAIGGPNPKQLTTPDAAMREGDFSALAGKIVVDPLTGQPFPNSRIPRARFDPIAAALLNMFPEPNTSQYSANVPKEAGQNDQQAMGKLDYEISSNDRFTARYFYDRNILKRDFGSVPGIYSDNGFHNQILTLRESHTFSPTLTGVATFSYAKTQRLEIPVTPVFVQDFTRKVPMANPMTPPELRITISQYCSLSTGSWIAQEPVTWQTRTQFAWSHGAHLLQFGFDFNRTGEWAADNTRGAGQFTFNASRTANTAIKGSIGDPFASFLLGLPSQLIQASLDVADLRQHSYQPWVQDDWKVRPNLTVNLGLRWEPWLPASDSRGALAALAPGVQSKSAPNAPLGLIFSGDIRDSIIAPDWNNLSPRAGFAWNVNQETVLRGGYGLYYHSIPLDMWRQAQPAFRSYSVTITNPPSFADPYANFGGSPFPFTPPSAGELQTYKFTRPLSAIAIDPGARTGYAQSWNFTLERRLPARIAASLAYVGNHSLKIMATREGNPALYAPGATTGNVDSRRVYQGLASVTLYSPFQSSVYHGMQFSAVRRAGRGFYVMANYVFSKVIDYGTESLAGGKRGYPRDPFNLRASKGVSDFDVTHRVNVSAVYDLPRITRAPLAGSVVNGWQLNAIAKLQTGLPFTVLTGADRSLVGVNRDHADLVGNPTRPAGADPILQYFNQAAFAVNALGTFGTSGRNILRGPGMQVVNFSAFKNFALTEKLRFQFRCEAFNFFNRANFLRPNATVSNVNYGRILAAQDPRVIQFGAKLTF
jgi:hypothetical protein